MIVSWNPASLDACALWRMFLPHLQMKGSRFTFTYGAMRMEEFAEADVVVVQRMHSRENLKALQLIKKAGMKLVYDLDDNLWSIPAYNPAKKRFAQYLEGFMVCQEEADLITVSTPGLKTAVTTALPHIKCPIEVIPNAIDFRLCKRPPWVVRDPEKVVVGWGGTSTHSGDILEVWSILPEVLEADQRIYMEFVGTPPPKEIINHPRVLVRDFVPVSEYFMRYSSWGWDIALGPLDANRFNRSKSNIRMLEAAAIMSPCLVSPFGSYLQMTELHPDLRYLRCVGKWQWKAKILELVADSYKRVHLGTVLHAVAREHFDVREVALQWESSFRSHLSLS